jgi:hypothetical protein
MVGSLRRGRLRGSPAQRQLKAFVNKKKLRRLHFVATVGGPWEYYLQKGTRKEQGRAEQGKTAQDTKKMEKAPLPTTKCRWSQTLCAGGGNRWLSRNRAQGSSLLPTLFTLLLRRSPGLFGAWLSASVAKIVLYGGKILGFRVKQSGFQILPLPLTSMTCMVGVAVLSFVT